MKTIQELIEEGIKIKTTCAQTNIQTIGNCETHDVRL